MYTVTTIDCPWMGKQVVKRLADAALLKLAWETNQPTCKGSVVVFDVFDYLVPASELEQGLAIKKKELEDQLAYFNQ